jgi:hypothetical protein
VNVNYPLFLSDLKETSIFWADFSKNQKPNFMKIHPVAEGLFLAD